MRYRNDSMTVAGARKQKGFTLLEIAIASVIIIFLAVAAVATFGGQSDSARATEAREFFIEKLPSALTSYGGAVGPTANIDAKDDLIQYGLPAETAWGGSWSVGTAGSAAGGVGIDYPIGGNNPDQIAADLQTFLSANNADGNTRFPFITAATADGDTLTVTIRGL